MPDPVAFDTLTPRFSLPLLWVGQAQKEHHVNESHALTDALLHCAIEGVASAPPTQPVDGENWLVGAAPSGVWNGRAGQLACRQMGNWLFVVPRDGMRLFNRATGQEQRYSGAWIAPARPAGPTGGTTVDSEARNAIEAILDCLESAGLIPSA